MKYFTSDEHFGHFNIIEYCNRPFKDVEEMNKILIKNHNEIVTPEDTVYHIGDFTLKSRAHAERIMARLNGNHVFIRGNHDAWDKDLPYIIETSIDHIYIVMCHYAMRMWPNSGHGSVQLYGHSHGKLPPEQNQWDVGVDNNNYKPISLEEIMLKIK